MAVPGGSSVGPVAGEGTETVETDGGFAGVSKCFGVCMGMYE